MTRAGYTPSRGNRTLRHKVCDGYVGDLNRGAGAVDAAAGAERDGAEEHHLGEARGVVEVGAGGCAAFAGVAALGEVVPPGMRGIVFVGSLPDISCIRTSGTLRIVQSLAWQMSVALVPMMSVEFSGSLRSGSKR